MKSKTTSEEDLVAMLKNGDKRVHLILYEQYSEALFGVIFRLVGDRQLAEEQLQDCFLKIWKYADSYDPDKARLFTWMVTIARNTAIDKVRTRAFKDRRKNQPLENHVSIIEKANRIHQQTDSIGIKEIIKELNTKYAILIDILYFKGYSQSEAAEELGIPLGTIKTRVRKAFQHLKKMLG